MIQPAILLDTQFIHYQKSCSQGSHSRESHSQRSLSWGSHSWESRGWESLHRESHNQETQSRGSHSQESHSQESHSQESHGWWGSPNRGSWHSNEWYSREVHSFTTLHTTQLLAFRCLIVSSTPFCRNIQFLLLLYGIIGFPGVSGYNTAPPPGPPPPNHPVGHSFHPLSQPAGVSVQPHQCMPPGSQMFGKFNLHHLSL